MKVVCSPTGVFALAFVATIAIKLWPELTRPKHVDLVTPFIGPGYRDDTRGWLDPTAFINQHRGAPLDGVGRMPVP